MSPKTGHYLRPAQAVRELLDRVQRGDVGDAERVQQAYSRLLGILQQTLDTARDDMEMALRRSRIRASAKAARRDPLEVLREFESIQTTFIDASGQLSELFAAPEALLAGTHTLTYVAAVYQDMAERLEVLIAQTASPHAERPPLGETYARGLGAMSDALSALAAFSEKGDRAELERCLREIDAACTHLESHRQELEQASDG
ncbi:MAG: hypothetical protein ACYCW6_26110 [Candidatus Xenobia bacterium]